MFTLTEYNLIIKSKIINNNNNPDSLIICCSEKLSSSTHENNYVTSELYINFAILYHATHQHKIKISRR